MAAVAGLRGTGDWGTDERPKNFREMILWRNPNGTAPIFALTARAGKRTTTDPEFSWWDEGLDIVRLQVNGALGSTDTVVVVDSQDPASGNLDRVYGSAYNLKAGDLLLVEPTSDQATFNHELIEVDDVQSSTQFTVRRGVGGTTPATIANDVYLTLIGSAYAEGTGVPPPTTRNPIKLNNYTQIFKDTYELTGTANETEVRTGNPWSTDKKRKMFDHSRAIEMAILFGRKYETTGSNGKPKRFMGGLREFIPSANTTIFGSAVTVNSLLTALEGVFNFDTDAGDERIVMGGNAALTELGKVFNAATNVNINYNTNVSVYGINFKEFITPRGRFLFRSHPLMSRHGLYKNSLFVLDFAAIKYVAMRNRDTKVRDDVQNKDEDLRRGYIQTECSLEVLHGGLTMAYLGNVSST